MSGKRPAFQFYPSDWLGDAAVRALTLSQRGQLLDDTATGVLAGTFAPFLRPEQRPYIPRDVRRQVLTRDQGRCRGCGASERIEMDHVTPWSRGGSSDPSNLQALCLPCNRSKGAR